MSANASISKRPIPVDKVIRSVLCPSAGGTAVFVGTVRDKSDGIKVSRLRMEAAEDLAKRDLVRIAKAAAARFDICKVTVRHRVGEMKVGEVIVVVAVSAPHRAGAFSACRYMIDQLKKSTPIWKKEMGGGKQRWVEAER